MGLHQFAALCDIGPKVDQKAAVATLRNIARMMQWITWSFLQRSDETKHLHVELVMDESGSADVVDHQFGYITITSTPLVAQSLPLPKPKDGKCRSCLSFFFFFFCLKVMANILYMCVTHVMCRV